MNVIWSSSARRVSSHLNNYRVPLIRVNKICRSTNTIVSLGLIRREASPNIFNRGPRCMGLINLVFVALPQSTHKALFLLSMLSWNRYPSTMSPHTGSRFNSSNVDLSDTLDFPIHVRRNIDRGNNLTSPYPHHPNIWSIWNLFLHETPEHIIISACPGRERPFYIYNPSSATHQLCLISNT
jgi:hypothetical protein